MKVHFVLPNKAAEEINGFLGRQHIIYDISELTAEKVTSAHRHFGAVLYASDTWAVRTALGLPQDFQGLRVGFTPSEYALSIGKSRQRVCQMIKSGKLKTERLGSFLAVIP